MRIETKEKLLKQTNKAVHLFVNILLVALLLLLCIPGAILFTIIFFGLLATLAVNSSREYIEERIEVKLYGKTKEIH